MNKIYHVGEKGAVWSINVHDVNKLYLSKKFRFMS